MFPTSTMPVSPALGSTGMGALLGIVAVGALIALVVGLVAHRREQQRRIAIELPETGQPADAPAKPRLSA